LSRFKIDLYYRAVVGTSNIERTAGTILGHASRPTTQGYDILKFAGFTHEHEIARAFIADDSRCRLGQHGNTEGKSTKKYNQ